MKSKDQKSEIKDQNYSLKIKITDNQDEIFDVVDINDNVIGMAKRGEVHGNPALIHRSVSVVVFNSHGELFMQQRSGTKDTDPLKWTISCSGHVSAGKNYKESAHRELIEELGMDLEIVPLNKFIAKTRVETEMVMLYRAESDGPFRLNSQEIIQGKFFTRKELNTQVKLGEIDLSFGGKLALGKLGWTVK